MTTPAAGCPAGLPPGAAPRTTCQRRAALAIATARETGRLARRRRWVLFTSHVTGQQPGHAGVALDCLLRARPAEVLHIEPGAGLLRPARRLDDLASRRTSSRRTASGTCRTPWIASPRQGRRKYWRYSCPDTRMISAPAAIRSRPAVTAGTAR
jgi:hypothetical protein